MKKTDRHVAVVEPLSAQNPFHERAPPEALACLERGLGQVARGEHLSLDELSKRLKIAAKFSGTTKDRSARGP